uniref:Uncharacterized protein n=1 Tax=Avena sativa TaxID=4498 RepID=A0ACD5X4X6_AVESA
MAPREKRVEQIVLIQSMFAAKNIRGQLDRLLEFQVQLRQQTCPIEEVVSGLAEVRLEGLNASSRYLTVCLKKATEKGARLAPDPSFSDWNQLFGAVKATKRLPARPTTQTEAYAHIQAALYAVKLLQEHLLPSCIDGLATATVQAAGSSSSSSIEEVCRLLGSACTVVVNRAINHIDLAVAAISRFVHPKEVASNSRFAERYTDFGWDMEALKVSRFVRGLEEWGPFKAAIKKLSSTNGF